MQQCTSQQKESALCEVVTGLTYLEDLDIHRPNVVFIFCRQKFSYLRQILPQNKLVSYVSIPVMGNKKAQKHFSRNLGKLYACKMSHISTFHNKLLILQQPKIALHLLIIFHSSSHLTFTIFDTVDQVTFLETILTQFSYYISWLSFSVSFENSSLFLILS